MASNYFNSLSPSFSEKVIEDFAGPAAENNAFLQSYTEKFPSVDKAVTEVYENGLQGLDSLDGMFPEEGVPATTSAPPAPDPGWTFITAPEDVNWDIANNSQRVDIFGTNNPPVVAGSRGMRDLTLSNSLAEGFMRGVSIEGKIAALENLMNYSLNSSDGFVSVPVYQVWANSKSYGGSNGYFIIKDIKVKEAMRDLKGNTTRAYVDISLMQVPAFQVNSGRDQASKTTAGAKSGLLSATDARNAQQAAQAAQNGKPGTNNLGAGQTGSPAGANTPKPSTTPTALPVSTGDPLRGTRAGTGCTQAGR
jgi:hypothetical protein